MPIEIDALPPTADHELPAEVSRGFVAKPTPLGLQSPAFQLGDTPAATEQIWRNLVPLYWLVEVGKLKPAAQVLATGPALTTGAWGRAAGEPPDRDVLGSRQDLAPSHSTQSEIPLIVFQYVGPGRVLFHAIDSTWRWRIGAGDTYFGRYWVQTIRFLARGKLTSGRGAQIAADRREYQEGDAVQLRGRFLDPRLAPAGNDVTVLINAEGQPRRRETLRRNPAIAGVFEGTLTDLAQGQYEVLIAEPQLPGNPPSGRFSIVSRPGELARTEMDAAALAAAAETTRGKFYTIASADRLLAELPAGRGVPLQNLPPIPLWNRWWLVMAFLACITSEWILRKRKGML